MRDVLGPGTILGYCTNVHAGATLQQAKVNLEQHALAVKRIVSPKAPMGVGLWLSAQATAEAFRQPPEAWIGAWLRECGLEAFTLNAFPFADFHEGCIKHRVYEPSWAMQDRRDYTVALATMFQKIIPGGRERSISTLPIGWPGTPCRSINQSKAGQHLVDVVSVCKFTRTSHDIMIHVDLEPEPGCILQRSADVVEFTHRQVDRAPDQRGLKEVDRREHLRVCHDICHAAVMFEPQAEVLKTYRAAGIKVGKVQISNAIRVPFDEYSEPERCEAMAQLSAFAEDRYLHQTMIRTNDGRLQFFEDLPQAIEAVPSGQTARGEWRVHFHVPLFLERFGLIQTTQDEIGEFLRAIRTEDEIHHFEIETYAWDVLPPELRAGNLAEGIARELEWVIEHFGRKAVA
jgi:hypothetical protein